MFKLLEKINTMTDGFTEEESKLFTESRFPYILSKADLYLRIGPEKYRKQDFFQMPDIEWTNDDMEVISHGCKQVLEGKGFTPEKAFTDIGIRGFRQLFSLFHFENIGRETSYPDNGKFLDKMEMRHFVEGGAVFYYNLVEYDLDTSDDT